MNVLLFGIRRILIELNNISSCAEALLLMALDLFYNNFRSLGAQLEEMYVKHYIEAEKMKNDYVDKMIIEKEKIKNGDSNLANRNEEDQQEKQQKEQHEFEEKYQ